MIFNRAKTIFAFETKVTISLNFTSPRSLFDLKQVKGCVCNEIITRGKLFYCPILLRFMVVWWIFLDIVLNKSTVLQISKAQPKIIRLGHLLISCSRK